MVLETIAVTGASGMLGRHVIASLESTGFRVIAYTRTSDGSPSSRSWDLTQWKAEHELNELFESVDAVIHAGAAVPKAARPISDDGLFDANVRAPCNLAGWARKRGLPIVYVSGAIVYADPNDESILEDAPLAWSGLGGFYGLTKLLAEDVLRREKEAGLRLAVLRPSSIYGYGLGVDKIVTSVAIKAQRGDVIELREPVTDSTNLVHAADVASAVVKVLQQRAWGTFNIASDSNTSVLELAKTCLSVTRKGTIDLQRTAGPARPPLVRFRLNCDSAKTRLGWSPRVTLAEGIRAVLDENVIVVS